VQHSVAKKQRPIIIAAHTLVRTHSQLKINSARNSFFKRFHSASFSLIWRHPPRAVPPSRSGWKGRKKGQIETIRVMPTICRLANVRRRQIRMKPRQKKKKRTDDQQRGGDKTEKLGQKMRPLYEDLLLQLQSITKEAQSRAGKSSFNQNLIK